MPCRTDDWPDHSSDNKVVYKDNPEHLDTINKLEAMLCALMNTLTLSYPHEMDGIINESENCGQVDIRKWWSEHRKDDIERLEKKLKKNFSIHERKLLKQILNK